MKSFFSNMHSQLISKTNTIGSKVNNIVNRVDDKMKRWDGGPSRKRRSALGTSGNVTTYELNDSLR